MSAFNVTRMCTSADRLRASSREAAQSEGTATPSSRLYASAAINKTQLSGNSGYDHPTAGIIAAAPSNWNSLIISMISRQVLSPDRVGRIVSPMRPWTAAVRGCFEGLRQNADTHASVPEGQDVEAPLKDER